MLKCDEEKTVNRMRLQTGKKERICKFQFLRREGMGM